MDLNPNLSSGDGVWSPQPSGAMEPAGTRTPRHTATRVAPSLGHPKAAWWLWGLPSASPALAGRGASAAPISIHPQRLPGQFVKKINKKMREEPAA